MREMVYPRPSTNAGRVSNDEGRKADEEWNSSSQGLFGCKSPPFHICSIRAPFSVARFVISGGYYHGSFEYVIESIVRLQLHNKAPDLTSHNA